jgi:hypothetical protein
LFRFAKQYTAHRHWARVDYQPADLLFGILREVEVRMLIVAQDEVIA